MSDAPNEPALSSPEELVGQELDGKYRIERVIGVGGMAAVYEARRQEQPQRCAIKVLLAETVADDPATLERFRREAAIARKLKNPHVVEFLDYGKLPDGRPYLVMEYLEGEGLDTRLAARGTFPLAEALHVLEGVEAALTPAHELAIVHRDLKPGNIFLARQPDGSEVVKLLDFGASKLQGRKLEDLTSRGLVIGTADYMSPEQARGQKLDPRSDVFSLGIVLFELLAGRRPFEAPRPVDILFRICSDPAPVLRSVAPSLPPEMDAVMAKALSKPAATRYDSIRELVAAVRSVVSGQGLPAASPQASPIPLQRPVSASGKRSKRTRAKITGAPVPGADPFEAMVYAGLVTREALEATRAEVGSGPALTQALVDRSLVGEVDLLRVFATLKNARYARLDKATRVNPQPEILAAFGAERARRFRVLPFSRSASTGDLQALVGVPVEAGAEEELAREFSGGGLQLILTTPAAIEAAQARWYADGAPARPTSGERKRRGTRRQKAVVDVAVEAAAAEAAAEAAAAEPAVMLAEAAAAEPPHGGASQPTAAPLVIPPALVVPAPALLTPPGSAPQASEARPRSQFVQPSAAAPHGGASQPTPTPQPFAPTSVPMPPGGAAQPHGGAAQPAPMPAASSPTPLPIPPPAPPAPPRPPSGQNPQARPPSVAALPPVRPAATPSPGPVALPPPGPPARATPAPTGEARPATLSSVPPVRPSADPKATTAGSMPVAPRAGTLGVLAAARPAADGLGARLLAHTLATLAEVLGADRVALVGGGGTALTHPPGMAGPDSIPPGVLSQAANNPSGVLIGDAATDYRFQASTAPVLQGVRTAMAIPLQHEGTRFGVLLAGATRNSPFRAGDLARLAMVAQQAAMGLALNAQVEALRRELAQRAAAPAPAPAPAPTPPPAPAVVEPPAEAAAEIRAASGLATVLCAEVVELPLSADKVPAEKVLRGLNQLLEDVASAVAALGGRVDRHLGSGLLAVWNQPHPTPDHAKRALEAARRILDLAAAFNFDGRGLTMRVGVHTGSVTVGRLGAARRFSEGTIGPAVLGAQRLGQLSMGQVIVSHDALQAAGMASLPEVMPMPPLELGLGQPLLPYFWSTPRAQPAFKVELGE